MQKLIVLMGPSGCGKSTIGAALSKHRDWSMVEGDDYHPQANKDKMAAGIALTDDDRKEWLASLKTAIARLDHDTAILACSALTPYVQSALKTGTSRSVKFVFLDVPKDDLSQRLQIRSDHFMPSSLLSSQLDALDVPQGAIRIAANNPVHQIIDNILTALENNPED